MRSLVESHSFVDATGKPVALDAGRPRRWRGVVPWERDDDVGCEKGEDD
jgi:hypothetical protein